MRALAVAILLASGTAAADVELLHSIPIEVAVSTTVANPKILPQHLADGKLETAWNSRTGAFDSVIRFRVPAGVHVTKLRLTAGFAHVEGKDDYFVMNPRIQSVHVTGTVYKTVPLDPENRGMQDVPIDGGGGDYEISFPKVEPGTKATWRELCISELEVWGDLPAGMTAAPTVPNIHVGVLSPPPLPLRLASAMLVYPTKPGMPLLVTLGEAPKAFVPRGAPIVVDPASATARTVAVVQPIAPPPELPAGLVGRVVRVEGKDAPVCDAVITDVGILADGDVKTAAPAASGATPAQLAAEAWANQRPYNRALVATLVSTSPCAGALFAHDPKATPKRGKLVRDKKLVAALKAKFVEVNYPRMSEAYMLNDLNGEYGDAAANEAKLPESERMSEDKVAYDTAIACDTGAAGHCIGYVHGSFGSHEGASAWRFTAGAIDDSAVTGCPHGAPLAAVDVDGDGAIDLLQGDGAAIGYSGAASGGGATFRDIPCN